MFEDRRENSPSPPSASRNIPARDCDIHVLLLGAGDVGKSTLFKQFRLMYGDGFSDNQDRKAFVDTIHNNVITQTKALIELAKGQEEFEMTDQANTMRACREIDFFSSSLAEATASVLRNPGVQQCLETFRYRSTIEYFLGKLKEISSKNFIPSIRDILACRIRTLGLVDQRIEIKGYSVRVTDTGGQRNERKKWWRVMDTCTCVLFVVNLNGYVVPLYEEADDNCLKEDLSLFSDIVNYTNFTQRPICVLLNQKDLFDHTLQLEDVRESKKLRKEVARCLRDVFPMELMPAVTAYCAGVPRYPLCDLFPEYTGGNCYEPAVEFITQKFRSLDRRKKDIVTGKPPPSLTFFTICARDIDEIQNVYSTLFTTVFRPVPDPPRSPSRSPSPRPTLALPLAPASASSAPPASPPTNRSSWTPSPSKTLRRIKRALSFKRENYKTAPAFMKSGGALFPLSLSPPAETRSLSSLEDAHLMIAGVQNAGKTTIYKQFLLSYGGGYGEAERKVYQSSIDKNVISQIKELIAMKKESLQSLSKDAEKSAKFLQTFDENFPLSFFGATAAITTVAEDSSMSHRIDRYRYAGNMRYFLNKLTKLAVPNYTPSIEDVLFTRITTVQNQTMITSINHDFRLRCTDTAARKDERELALETATCLLFVTNLNAYIQPQGLHEDLLLFDELCNSEQFAQAPVFVLLAQKDMFRQTLQRSELLPIRDEIVRRLPDLPTHAITVIVEYCTSNFSFALSTAFPDYTGAEEYEECLNFIKKKFQALDRRDRRSLQFFSVCATDTAEMKPVFSEILHILMK